MRWRVLVVLILLILPASATEYRFYQGSISEIWLVDCQEIEILRYEDVPAEESIISEVVSELAIEEIATSGELSEDRTQIRSTSSSFINKSSFKRESPYVASKEELKKFYKENDFKVLGETRKPCPAKFRIKVPDPPGFYYLPVKSYSYDGEEVRYIGIEVLKVKPEINITNSSFTEPVERPKKSYTWAWFILIGFITFFFGLIFKKLLRKVIRR